VPDAAAVEGRDGALAADLPTLMARLVRHGQDRHAPTGGQLLRYADGRPVTTRRYDHLWVRIGRQLPWVRTQQISIHWIRHTTGPGCAASWCAAGVRGGLLRITRRNAGVQRGSEERVLRRVRGEPRRSRLRARGNLSEVAAAAPVMASAVLGLPAPDGPALEAGSPVTNDPGSGGWAVASWLLTAALRVARHVLARGHRPG
jgi:hypothetical protein